MSLHIRMSASMHACEYVRLHVYIFECLCIFSHACVHAGLHYSRHAMDACLNSCECVSRMWVYLYASLYVCMHESMYVIISECIQAFV